MDSNHWGRVTHIGVSKLTMIGSENGLSPGRCQDIIWTNAVILLIKPLWTKYSEILIYIQIFSFTEMHPKQQLLNNPTSDFIRILRPSPFGPRPRSASNIVSPRHFVRQCCVKSLNGLELCIGPLVGVEAKSPCELNACVLTIETGDKMSHGDLMEWEDQPANMVVQ